MKSILIKTLFLSVFIIAAAFTFYPLNSVADNKALYSTQLVKFHITNCDSRVSYCIDGGTQYTNVAHPFTVELPYGNHSICVMCGSNCGTQTFSVPGGGGVIMDVYVTIGGACACDCSGS